MVGNTFLVEEQRWKLRWAFSSESKKRVEWDTQVLKENNNQPKMLYPAKLSFKNEEEIKSFSNKKLKERGARDQTANIYWIK